MLQNIEKHIVPRESTAREVHLNGYTIGFHPHSQKLNIRDMSP